MTSTDVKLRSSETEFAQYFIWDVAIEDNLYFTFTSLVLQVSAYLAVLSDVLRILEGVCPFYR